MNTTLMDCTVRDAVAADLPGIVDIYNSTIASREVTADLEAVTVESRRAWFEAHGPGTASETGARPARPLWVVQARAQADTQAPTQANFGSALLGWLSFSDFYGRPAYAATAELSIYLAPQARGRGLGSGLLRRAIEAAPGLGIQTLLGFIFGHNTASLALFERAGFATWGRLPRVARLDERERDLLIVGLRIDHAARQSRPVSDIAPHYSR